MSPTAPTEAAQLRRSDVARRTADGSPGTGNISVGEPLTLGTGSSNAVVSATATNGTLSNPSLTNNVNGTWTYAATSTAA